MKRYCNVCDKEVILNENNECPKCGLLLDNDELDDSEDNDENRVSLALKILAGVVLFLGFIAGIFSADSEYEGSKLILMLPYWILSGVSALFIYALAEIIQLLDDIKQKL